MKTMTWESIFGPVTGKRKPHQKLGTKFAEPRTLEEDTWFDGIEYAKGSKYNCFETENFGFVVFHKDSLTPSGHTPGKFTHRF